MALLSININKFALIRNSRGTNHPDLVEIAERCIKFAGQGITLHPRPDERHAKFSDLPLISKLVSIILMLNSILKVILQKNLLMK